MQCWLSLRNNFDDGQEYSFAGSIPEMVAQWEYRQQSSFTFILDLVSEHGTAHFDL
jgi:hypothetical protein